RRLNFAARYTKRGATRVALAVELGRCLVDEGDRRSDLELEALGIARLEVGATPARDERLDRPVEGVAAGRDRLDGNDFAEHDHRHFGRAGAEVDHDDAIRAGNRDL